jgi:hypothetical protein
MVEREAIEARAMLRSKALEPVEVPLLVEDAYLAFERKRSVEDAGAAAGRLFGVPGMWRAVGAEKEFG